MSDWLVLGMFVLLVIVVAVLVLVVFIYRWDVIKAARRKDDQSAQWGMELAKVSGVLATTQELLQAQQDSNKIILQTNEKLTAQVAEIQRELRGVREELRGVREELKQMTARAEAAEDKVD